MSAIEATFYAQVEPTFGKVWRNGSRVDGVEKIRVTQIWQKRPTTKVKGVVIKLTLSFDEAAFMPLQPAAVIQIPSSLVGLGSVMTVEATDADGNSAAVLEHLAAVARGEA